MRILYPENILNNKEADEPYQAEFLAVQSAGIECSLFDFDSLAFGAFLPSPKIQAGERILYRGWMMTPEKYAAFVAHIQRQGGVMITSPEDYVRCHHLPGWYEQCRDLTAETHFFAADETLEGAVTQLGWPEYFVKDYVKSNTGDKGSVARSPAEVCEIVDQLRLYRGEIEGGVAIRRVEKYLSETECRYFLVRKNPYGCQGTVPELVHQVANCISAPFYSVDVVTQDNGQLRLVELGDGQVSDKKEWPVLSFVDILRKLI